MSPEFGYFFFIKKNQNKDLEGLANDEHFILFSPLFWNILCRMINMLNFQQTVKALENYVILYPTLKNAATNRHTSPYRIKFVAIFARYLQFFEPLYIDPIPAQYNKSMVT